MYTTIQVKDVRKDWVFYCCHSNPVILKITYESMADKGIDCRMVSYKNNGEMATCNKN